MNTLRNSIVFGKELLNSLRNLNMFDDLDGEVDDLLKGFDSSQERSMNASRNSNAFNCLDCKIDEFLKNSHSFGKNR